MGQTREVNNLDDRPTMWSRRVCAVETITVPLLHLAGQVDNNRTVVMMTL